MSIRIALDATPEVIGSTGVARYSRELRLALDRRPDCLLTPFAIGRTSHDVPAGVRHVRLPLRVLHTAWRSVAWPRAEDLAGPADVVHSLDLIPPPTRLPLVVTVHDVVTADLPEMHPARSRRMQRAQLAALPRAAAVLAVSSTTAGALAERGVTQDRIYVTPNGLSRFPAPVDPPIPPGPFVLVVGSLEPRKGHELLLRALARASLDHVRVVFAGPDGGREEEIRQLAARLGLDDRLRLLGRVDDAVLAGLYRDAAALCLPSHGEGFGLPVLEAMSFGTAVLASDLPALHEVAGDAALFAAVGEETEWSRQLQRVLGDDALRQQLGRQGRQRAELFSWDATAAETVRAYRAAIGQR